MASDTTSSYPHRRYNPLKDEWVIVSPQRLNRPWKGQIEKSGTAASQNSAAVDSNPLLPGALRPGGVINPLYESTFVFTNDFPALLPNLEEKLIDQSNELFQSSHAHGTCKVMCFHPNSELQLPTMSQSSIVAIIEEWMRQMKELGRDYEWVQIFENKGQVMGCSNPHPHCQIWSSTFLPNEPLRKDKTQKLYFEKHKKPMLVDYKDQELQRKERIVVENDDWLTVVPYWAVWPFETMLIPKRHILRLIDLQVHEVLSLADIMKKLLVKYDNLFKCSFPYSMGWLGAPTGKYLNVDCNHWQLHAVWLPPLLRSATVRKFIAGYELICEPQRDLTPEKAAEILRSQSDTHYTCK